LKSFLWGIIVTLLSLSCENPFDVTPTDENELFQLKVTHSISRIVTTGEVTLKWSEVMVEGFSRYIVERRPVGDSIWTSLVDIKNRIQTKYVDLIRDDQDLDYRVGISDTLGNIRWATASIQIPLTRQLYVPDERSTIQQAIYDSLIDPGDTVWVHPGAYYGKFNLMERDIVLKSTAGPDTTFLLADSTYLGTVLTMNMGLVEGFTISGGESRVSGGGVLLKGTGEVRRCIITGNQASFYGGGIYMSNDAIIMNCIIYDNSARAGSNIYFRDAHGKVINNTITFVEAVRSSCMAFGNKNRDLNFQNNIIVNPKNYSNISILESGAFSGVRLDYSLMKPAHSGVNSNGINDVDPLFIGYVGLSETYDFHLSPASPALHAGNSAQIYNNPDGSRNTMGAYGGPYGE
jgi:hypothetical protein